MEPRDPDVAADGGDGMGRSDPDHAAGLSRLDYLWGDWLVYSAADRTVALASIGYIGLLPTMLGNIFFLYGVAAVGAARAAAFLYLSPLFSAAFAIAWLGERIAWYHVGGIAAIFAGLYLLGRPGAKRDVVAQS
jgi:drug/metabolite transporter (DMT)-like permease